MIDGRTQQDPVKIAISGKGGVGKSTVTAALALLMAEQGTRVLAVDADPDANLANALGLPRSLAERLVPIATEAALIEERTGAKGGTYGQMFKINPEVSDIADRYAVQHCGVDLLVLGAVQRGGGGCACPESVLLRALVSDLVLHRDEALLIDMEAGIEHLGRATARGVDVMLAVVEPGQRSVDSAARIASMAADIGLTELMYVANKVMDENDKQFLRDTLPDGSILAFIPFDQALRAADRGGNGIRSALTGTTEAACRELLRKVVQS